MPRLVLSSAAFTALPIYIGLAFVYFDGITARMSTTSNTINQFLSSQEKIREIETGLGHCWFYSKVVDIDTFVKNWDCMPTGSPRILVVGDSHSADRAWGLRLAGFGVGYIGSAGCRLSFGEGQHSPRTCRAVYDKAKEVIASGGIDGIVLAQRFADGTYTDDALDKMADEWLAFGLPVAFFTPMPRYGNFQRKWQSALDRDVPYRAISHGDDSLREITESVLSLKDRKDITILHTLRNFCGDLYTPCSPFDENLNPLIVDYSHWSTYGAFQFARNILTDPTWNRWIERVKRRSGQHIASDL